MKRKSLQQMVWIVSVAVVALAGCGPKEEDINKQFADAKKQPAPSAEQMKKGWDQIAANHEKSAEDQKAWARAHPEKLAEVNASRARKGLPPLTP